MKIGLLGGSFDPIHKAHIEIAQNAIKQLNLDEFYFIPTKNNPWKDGVDASSIQRVKMIEIATRNHPNMHVSTIEIDDPSNEKNYTYLTLEKLCHDDNEYYFIMGSDQCNSFDKWKEAKKISEMVHLVVLKRGGIPLKQENIDQYHFISLENVPMIASSTEIKQGKIEMLDQEVLRYISKEGLYLNKMIASRMKEHRYNHSCSVAKLCKELADSNGLDANKAYIAGIMHDVAKEMDIDKSRELMETYYPTFIDKPIPVWHQWTGAYVCEHEFLIDDKEILKAIENHTTASLDISRLGMCLYCADKLDPLRGYDSSSSIELCKKDIEEGFKNELNHFYEFSKEKGRSIDPIFNDIYMKFCNKEL